jgi:DNA uptake protein ComE-like DNA-binding protein
VDRDSDDDDYDESSEYHGSRLEEEESSDLDLGYRHTAAKALTRPETTRRRVLDSIDDPENHSPRTTHILSTINSRKVDDIKLLRGIGSRKAQTIVDCLSEMDNGRRAMTMIRSLAELGNLKGVGMRTVENMRNGIEA